VTEVAVTEDDAVRDDGQRRQCTEAYVHDLEVPPSASTRLAGRGVLAGAHDPAGGRSIWASLKRDCTRYTTDDRPVRTDGHVDFIWEEHPTH